MTDIDKFIDLYKSTGIEFERIDNPLPYPSIELNVYYSVLDDGKQEQIEKGEDLGIITTIIFHEDGSYWYCGILRENGDVF